MRPLEDEPLIGDRRRWYSVRSHYVSPARSGKRWMKTYEERIVLFEADNAADAIRQAEIEAAEYVEDIDAEVLPFFQSFMLFDEIGQGAEIYSMMRDSRRRPDNYLDRYFDTGATNERREY